MRVTIYIQCICVFVIMIIPPLYIILVMKVKLDHTYCGRPENLNSLIVVLDCRHREIPEWFLYSQWECIKNGGLIQTSGFNYYFFVFFFKFNISKID